MKDEKLTRLQRFIESTPGPVVVAVSGGVDSTFLLKFTLDVRGRGDVFAVFMDSPFCSVTDRGWVEAIGEQLEVEITAIRWDPLKYLEIRSNTRLRCYWCKLHMYSILKEKMEKFCVKSIFDGTQADDLHRDRPGLSAIKRLKILTPLADFSLTKAEIRCESNKYGLVTADRVSEACLATRIAPARLLTLNGLTKVDEGLLRGIVSLDHAVTQQ